MSKHSYHGATSLTKDHLKLNVCIFAFLIIFDALFPGSWVYGKKCMYTHAEMVLVCGKRYKYRTRETTETNKKVIYLN